MFDARKFFGGRFACRTDNNIVGKKLRKCFEKPSIAFPHAFPLRESLHLLMNPDMTLNPTSPISHKVCIITSGLYFVSKQSDGYLIAAIGSPPNHTS